MTSAPIVNLTLDLATTGMVDPFKNENVIQSLGLIPQKWSLQVTGLTAANVVAAPTSWDVFLLGSLDGLAFSQNSAKILEHVNTSNVNGDVVYGGGNFYATRFIRINVQSLSLGATATKIRVSVLGVA